MRSSAEGQAAFSSKVKAAGPYVIKGIDLPADSYEGVKEMQQYFDAGKTAPALEFVSPVKGPNLENITVAVGSGTSGSVSASNASYNGSLGGGASTTFGFTGNGTAPSNPTLNCTAS